jgi:hypothetical protein
MSRPHWGLRRNLEGYTRCWRYMCELVGSANVRITSWKVRRALDQDADGAVEGFALALSFAPSSRSCR